MPRSLSCSVLLLALGSLPMMTSCGHTEEKKRSVDPDTGQSTADKLYQVALGSFHSGMWEDAKRQVQRALDEDADHDRAHYLKGLLSLREGKTMIDALEGEMCLQDESSMLQRERADDLHRQAHEAFRRAAETSGDSASNRGRAMNSMSVVSIYFQDYDRAIAEAKAALAADFYGERWSALGNLGWAYYQRGDKVEAMTELRQSVMLNPNFCVGRYRLAEVYLEIDMVEQALEEVGAVLRNEECQLQEARMIEGVARAKLGDLQGAQNAFDACVALSPRSCVARECQGLASYAQGETIAVSE